MSAPNANLEPANAPAKSGAFPVPDPIGSLYVHVPFCAHKCEYCAFYSKLPAADMVDRYVSALIREMELVAHDLRPRTVFFGGGTPSILSLKQWQRVLEAMARLNLLGAEEWTVECNPATVSADKAKLLRDHGVNRVSMGVQSMDPKLLERLGRIHSREQVFRSFDILRAAGFDNLNLDLMFGIPSQTLEIWQGTLREIIALGTEHLSCYEVIYEDDTPLFAQLQAGKFDVDEDLIETLYETLVEESAAAGYRQYEVANFAKDPASAGADTEPTRACRHNTNYWRGGAFHALGPSATGFVRGTRTKNWSNTQLYCEQLEKGRRAIESSETLTPLASAGETAAFGLRMNRGWQFEEFQRITGHDLEAGWARDMDELVAEDLALRNATGFRLSQRGLRFADHAAAKFLRPTD